MSNPNMPKAVSVEYLASKKEPQNLSISAKLKYYVTHITVEPIIFIYMLSLLTNVLATQNLSLEKACRVNLKFNDTICDALVARNKSGYDIYHEAEVQKLVTKFSAFRSILIGTVPVILMMFLGSWSDRHMRRKPIILMPLLGDWIGVCCLFICSYYFLELSLEYSWLAETIPHSTFGGWGCSSLGIYSYISGKSKTEDRTLKIGAASLCHRIGMSVGTLLSGIALNRLGFKGVYLLTGTLLMTGFLYGVFVIKEDEKLRKKKLDEDKKNNIETQKGNKSFLRDFFDLQHIKNTINVCFKEGEGNRRQRMIVIMFVAMLIKGPLKGELNLFYMYTRLKFGWNEVDYSLYNTYHFIIQVTGNIFALTFFSKYLQINDAMLSIIGVTSKTLATIMYAFAPSGIYLFVGSTLDIFHATTHVALRSILSKIVLPQELAQSNSVFGICEAMMPLVFGPLYSTIYTRTITIFPGAFFLASVVLNCITVSLLVWLYKESIRQAKIKLRNQGQREVEEALSKTRIIGNSESVKGELIEQETCDISVNKNDGAPNN